MATSIPQADLISFHDHLAKSKRILALCGAGLSASSGLPTFRGKGGLWRTHEATSLATPEAWRRDPVLVWHFYNYRRHMALTAKPNAAHYALAELARQKPDFQCLTQNVDGLSQRAKHPRGQLQLLHGSLFDVKCDAEVIREEHTMSGLWADGNEDDFCTYKAENFNDPFCPALALSTKADPTTNEARAAQTDEPDISDISVPLSKATQADLPQCPQCTKGTLRPGVVWFGERLPADTLSFVDAFIGSEEPIDLILVIGTSAKVYPAAGYVAEARSRNTRVAVINMDANDVPEGGGQKKDWFFVGDAAAILPKLLRPVIGDITSHIN